MGWPETWTSIFVFGGRCCPANSFLKVHCQHFSGSCRASSMPNTSATASTNFYPRWSHLQWEENIIYSTVIILNDEIRWTCTWPEVDEQSFFNSLVLHTTDAYIYNLWQCMLYHGGAILNNLHTLYKHQNRFLYCLIMYLLCRNPNIGAYWCTNHSHTIYIPRFIIWSHGMACPLIFTERLQIEELLENPRMQKAIEIRQDVFWVWIFVEDNWCINLKIW